VPAFVTKDDARDAQHAEAQVYGGQNPRGGMAAQMQVSGELKLQVAIVANRCAECGRQDRQCSTRQFWELLRAFKVGGYSVDVR
jgi:hypothetical protein